MSETSFVLEFVVDYIQCKNLSAMGSPLHVAFPRCAPIVLDPKSVSLTKITYQKGKRLIFKHDNLLDLNAQFVLRAGHGNLTTRGKCSIDFFDIAERVSECSPIYQIDVTISRQDGSQLGVMYCSFQIFPYQEYLFSIENQHSIKREKQNSANAKIIRPTKSARSQRRSSDCQINGQNKIKANSSNVPKDDSCIRKNPRRYNTRPVNGY